MMTKTARTPSANTSARPVVKAVAVEGPVSPYVRHTLAHDGAQIWHPESRGYHVVPLEAQRPPHAPAQPKPREKFERK